MVSAIANCQDIFPALFFLPMWTIWNTRKLENAAMIIPVTAGSVADIRNYAFIYKVNTLYNVLMWQVERFIDQVTTNEVALTGLRFVTLNRRLVLTVSASQLVRVRVLITSYLIAVTVRVHFPVL
jgi:hypothetical protein